MNPVGNLVKSQFENKNMGVAAIFFLLPFIMQFFFWFVFGVQADFAGFFVRTVIPALLTWVISAIAFYILLLGFKGKSARGTFSPVLCALPVFNLVYFFGFLVMSVIFFFAVPQFFQKRGLSVQEVSSISYSIASNPQLIHWLLLIMGILVGLGVIASYFYIAAKIGKLVADTGAFSNAVLVVVFAAISFIIFSILTIAFAAI